MGKRWVNFKQHITFENKNMHGYNRYLAVITLLVVIVCSGCGRGNPNRAEVHGTVTLDGQALDQGTISFLPSGQTKGPAAGASIVDGSYSISADAGPAIGTNRVEIRSARATGGRLPNGDPAIDEFIPSQYNTKTKLTVTIEPGGNIADFPLQLK